jgi:fructose-bisphosphate aldolase, class I
MTDTAQIATAMVAHGKGILAADESPSTMNARLQQAGVQPSPQQRRAYREMLVTTAGLTDGVSAVILCDETFRQQLTDGRSFPAALTERGLLPGIKVDTGVRPLAGAPGETITEGLDGLRERLAEYVTLGARFAKWRAVIRIGARWPSWRVLHANAHALARYAALCQDAGIVPIVEPEVLRDGDHTISRCADVTVAMLLQLCAELADFGVDCTSMVLKPSMVTPGSESGQTVWPEEVAAHTVRALRCAVPADVAGIAFLSGGQQPAQASANLAALQQGYAPWPLTFSFGRALVDPALAAWHGEPDRVEDGQRALANRVACNVAALQGSYVPALERSYALALAAA